MKVAYTVEQCWHRVPGGTAVSLLGAARALVERPDVDLVGVAAWHRDPARAPFTVPMEVRHLPMPRAALYESWHRLRRPRVEVATGPVDIVHATTFATPPASAPLAVTVHDLAFLQYPAHFTGRGLRFFHRGLSLVRSEAAVVFCPSEATARICEANGIERSRLRVVPHGIDMPTVTDRVVEVARHRYGLPDRYVLWVGTTEPRKNLPRLLDAMTSVLEDRPDVRLVLVGPTGWKEDLGPLVDPLGERAQVLGFVPDADLAALYAGATVFAYPSLAEGFGLPVLEAMAHGVAVVTSRGTATEEVVGDAGVLVEPTSSGSIATAVGELLDDHDQRIDRAHAGTTRAAGFTWERAAAAMVEAYRAIL